MMVEIDRLLFRKLRPTHQKARRYEALRKGRLKSCVVGVASMFVGGCTSNGGDATALVAGVYRGSLTNRSNTCPVIWTNGMMSTATITIGQMGTNITIQVDGTTSPSLQAIFGTNSFAGIVRGKHIEASITGTAQTTLGGCVYTSNGELAADLGGETLSGDVIYTPQTNGHADCTSMQVTGCNSRQTFGFTRTP
jgi:hypothetical protein